MEFPLANIPTITTIYFNMICLFSVVGRGGGLKENAVKQLHSYNIHKAKLLGFVYVKIP